MVDLGIEVRLIELKDYKTNNFKLIKHKRPRNILYLVSYLSSYHEQALEAL